MIEITMLGTSCMVPTKERNVAGLYAEIKGKGILFDCGEGTQRQMNIAGINRNKVQYIFISHWHADHMSGLLGLFQTVQNSGVEEFKLFGPKGTKKHLKALLNASVWDSKLNIDVTECDCKNPEMIFENSDFKVEALNIKHNTPCLAFALTETDKRKMLLQKVKKAGIPEGPLLADLQNGIDVTFKGKKLLSKDFTRKIKGKKVTYIADTLFFRKLIDLAHESDLLISEATYREEQLEKADQHNHMTARQSAQIASISNSKKLLLNHFSQRYKDINELIYEAKDLFPETEATYDLMKIKVK